jgi:hypothetical protein
LPPVLPLLLWRNCYDLGSPTRLAAELVSWLSTFTQADIQGVPITDRTYVREQTSAGCKIPPAVATPLIKGGRGDPHAIGSASDLGCVSPD